MSTMWASWFTTSSLFVFVNLTIFTIYLITRFSSQRKPQFQHHQQQQYHLTRVPSVLERVRSFNFSLYKFEQHNPEPEPEPPVTEYRFLQHEESEHVDPVHNPDPPTQIARTPSSLERIDPDPPTQIARTPSLLERLKSINFPVLYRSESVTPETEIPGTDSTEPEHELSDPDQGQEHGHLLKSKSENGVVRAQEKPAEKMKKSASEKLATFGYDEEVDAKADDFINRFKKQLRLQRLDSLLRSRGN
ncbi:pathogen-associated molecular patterns-induced protein A70-like [Fagus crenata]